MASYKSLLVILAMVFPAIASATDFIVGDQNGWTLGVDYQAWAQGKNFQVGDRLVFKYPVGAHNVFKVNGTDFKSCTKPPPGEALSSGNDIIVLAKPGNKWYICGVGPHCSRGQKLAINVNVKSKALGDNYGSSGNGLTLNIFYTIMVVSVVVLAIFCSNMAFYFRKIKGLGTRLRQFQLL